MSEQLANEEVSAVLVHSPAGASLSASELLKTCIECFNNARKGMMLAAYTLYQIRERQAWQEEYSSFNEYLLELKIDHSQASRLCAVIEHYVMSGKCELAHILHHNPERLYKAMKLPFEPEEQALRAEVWSMQEIKAELARKQDGSEHECVSIEICKTCGKRM